MGSRPYWFTERCNEILSEEKLVEFVGRVASGKETEERIVRNGTDWDRVRVECSTHDRLEAFKMLAEWGVGKPLQLVRNVGSEPSDSVRQAQQIFDMIKELEAGQLVSGGTNGNH